MFVGSRRFAFLLLCLNIVFPETLQARERPNILFAFADDWGRYASAYRSVDGPGSINDVAQTPTFDRIAQEGVLFRNAFVNAPSCTPCRSALLSGQHFFRTGQGAILQGAVWDANIPSFPLLLRDGGYHIGHTYKVWSPGTPRDAPYGGKEFAYVRHGRKFNSFSQRVTAMLQKDVSVQDAKDILFEEVVANFDDFLAARPANQPFCYWFGPTNVHRKWTAGSGKRLWGIDPDDLQGKMPAFLPDVPIVREDMADYLGEIKAFDASLERLLAKLESIGELDNTVIVVSGDHGAPGFPRGKCNLYDFGVAVPLAIRFPPSVPQTRVVDDFVSLIDLAPTLLEVSGESIPPVMSGKSLVPILESNRQGQVEQERTWVVTGRERHVARARPHQLPYPQRAIRTKDFLYVVNFRPERWPMGDPMYRPGKLPTRTQLREDTFVAFADLDASPTKAWMLHNQTTIPEAFDLGFGKRPADELYDLKQDPDQINNVADAAKYAQTKADLRTQLFQVLRDQGDPRVLGDGQTFEQPPFAAP